MRGLRIVKWVFLVVGLLFLAFAITGAINTRRFIARAERAPGVVIDMLRDMNGHYAPRVRFRTSQGVEITFDENEWQKPAAFSVGDSVAVLYLPDHPADARVDTPGLLWGIFAILGGMGVVFSGIGGGIILFGMIFMRKKEYLLTHGIAVETDVQGVELNESIEFNRRNPWRIASQWMDPASGRLRVFHSENLWFDPTRFVPKVVTVRIDPRNPKRYYMDVSFLPALEGDA